MNATGLLVMEITTIQAIKVGFLFMAGVIIYDYIQRKRREKQEDVS